MDNFYLNGIVAEIAPTIVGRVVNRILIQDLNLEIDLRPGAGALIASLDPARPGLYYTKRSRHARNHDRTRGKEAAAPFLNKLIEATLSGISKQPFDRIVGLEFKVEGFEEPSQPQDLAAPGLTLIL